MDEGIEVLSRDTTQCVSENPYCEHGRDPHSFLSLRGSESQLPTCVYPTQHFQRLVHRYIYPHTNTSPTHLSTHERNVIDTPIHTRTHDDALHASVSVTHSRPQKTTLTSPSPRTACVCVCLCVVWCGGTGGGCMQRGVSTAVCGSSRGHGALCVMMIQRMQRW